MFDDAALALEEIEPEDKTRTEVLGARIALYITAKKWDMAAAVASHLVKVEPENEAWWINLAYSVRRSEGIEQAEAILLRARAIHPKVAMIAFNLACYASVSGRTEEAKVRLRHAITLDKDIRGLAIDDGDLRPLWDWIAVEVVGRVFLQRHPFARIEIGGRAGDAGDVKRPAACSLFASLQLRRGFGNGATPPSNGAFHKLESSHSHLMAIFAANSRGSLLCCPIHSL